MNFRLSRQLLLAGLCLAGTALAPLLATAAPVTFDLGTATLQDVQNAMSAGAITSVELTNLYLNRINAYNNNSTSGPKLKAIAQVNPNVAAEAAAADELRANGTVLGPLHGIPFVVKHSYAVKGLALTGGESMWKDLIAPDDAPSVKLLRAAGAVFLGYANMSTFAISATTSTSEDYGTTLNAYVAGYVPGGSSGGSGCATGANLSFFAFGGETGGSIRNPSERAGIVGFKPSVGTVPIGGVLALVPNRDVIGPMARYAVDSATIMDVVAKRQADDIWAPIIPILSSRPAPMNYKAGLSTSLAGKKIGVIGTFIGKSNPNYTGSSASSVNWAQVTSNTAEITTLFNAARSTLTSLGATVKEVYLTAKTDSEATRASGLPRRMFYFTGTTYGDQNKAYAHRGLLEFLLATPSDYPETLRPKVLARADLNNNITDAIQGYMKNGQDLPFTSEVGIENFRATRDILNDFDAWMMTNDIDYLVWPSTGSKSSSSQSYSGTDLTNYLGLPLVTVPMGKLSTGEPTTASFCGRLYEDTQLLSVAYAYEQGSKQRFVSPLTPALDGETFTYDPAPVTAARSVSAAAVMTTAADAAEPTVAEDKLTAVPPDQRAEKKPPVVSISARTALLSIGGSPRLVVRGLAVDKSGLRRLEVTINGKRMPVKTTSIWAAQTAAGELELDLPRGEAKAEVVVLAEDKFGNTTVARRTVNLPKKAYR